MLKIVRTVLVRGPGIIYAYFNWMRKYSKNPSAFPIEERYNKLRILISKICKSLKVEFVVEGLDKLPNETFYVVSNHLSAFDPLLFLTAFEKPTSFVAKKEIEKMPFVNKCVESIEGKYIDRDNIKQSLEVMNQLEEDLKIGNKNWIIFPEGTRNKDQRSIVKEFHAGTFRPAVKSGVPIVPVTIYGTFRVLKNRYEKIPVFIKVLDPIYPKDYKDKDIKTLADGVHESIQNTLTSDILPRDSKRMAELYRRFRKK